MKKIVDKTIKTGLCSDCRRMRIMILYSNIPNVIDTMYSFCGINGKMCSYQEHCSKYMEKDNKDDNLSLKEACERMDDFVEVCQNIEEEEEKYKEREESVMKNKNEVTKEVYIANLRRFAEGLIKNADKYVGDIQECKNINISLNFDRDGIPSMKVTKEKIIVGGDK